MLHDRFDDRPVELLRSQKGRNSSRARYRRAFAFFPEEESGGRPARTPMLYFAGITAQLAISSHLFNVGFSDDWCRRNIGLRVAKSLAYANATGFRCHGGRIAQLAQILTPYNQWIEAPIYGSDPPDDGGLSADDVRQRLSDLLEHVRQVTGHRTEQRAPRVVAEGGGSHA